MKLILNIDRDNGIDFLEKVLVEELQQVVQESIYQEGLDGYYEVSLSFVEEEEIQRLNKDYRKKDQVTDVLSFPLVSPKNLKGEAGEDPRMPQLLGDIVICTHQAEVQAKEYGHTLRRELCFLVCHSMLHLLGYDHEETDEREKMQQKERYILENLKITRGVGGFDMTDMELMKIAEEAMHQAYVPYSHFPVGAALLTTDGQVYTGCNIENASYGATNCAERTALFKAVSEGQRQFSKLAIVSILEDETFPCGICRQVLSEFSPDLTILLGSSKKNILKAYSLRDLLPHSFTAKDLERN